MASEFPSVRHNQYQVTFLEALGQRVLVGDGANGTYLAAMGFHRPPYDLANILAPDLVSASHRAYFEAGADFVETNTFMANRYRLGDAGLDIALVNRRGAELARSVVPPGRYVLGAIGPAGRPMEPIGSLTAEAVHAVIAEQAEALVEGGVDGFLLETFTDLAELIAAVGAVRSVSKLPILVSKAYIEDGESLAEGLPMRCVKALCALDVVAVGANCVVGPQRMLDLVRQMTEESTVPILAFPTPGLPQLVKGQVTYDTSPDYFAKASLRLLEEGARIVGGCCGTTPEHIRQLRIAVDSGSLKVRPRAKVATKEVDKAPIAVAEPSELSQKLGRKFVTAVELDVPRGLNLEKLLTGARSMKIAGADVINISDGARARLRMNPAAVSALVQSKVGIEVTMHFSCRDRNVLAIQSDLLGWHALGLRNILAVTGDPANIGDYPSATSVFDIDAIGLIRILNRYNQGIDLAGYSVGLRCAFTIGCAYNPNAIDQKLEDDRLRRKVDSGANVVYTQPVFDLECLDRCARICDALGVPVLVGVLPLRSSRHAEFMHNEVPGISVPEALRKTLAESQDDASALEVGVEAAQQLVRLIRSRAQGLYLMPPVGHHALAERVMSA